MSSPSYPPALAPQIQPSGWSPPSSPALAPAPAPLIQPLYWSPPSPPAARSTALPPPVCTEKPPSKIGMVVLLVTVGVLALAILSLILFIYCEKKKKKPTPLPSPSPSLSPSPSPSPLVHLAIGGITFTYEELAVATEGFSEGNFLGEGGFGYVHRGVVGNGKEVAVKQLKPGSRQGESEFQAEVEIISRVHHKHLVSLVGYCITGAKRFIIYEFVPNNTLEFHLHGKQGPTMNWPTRLKIALGTARGLAYLHEECHPRIIHRDIKAANILLDFNFEAKVADFGLAKFFLDADSHVSTRVKGTFGYLDPEYALSGKLTDKSDVFSFGVILLELITGRKPVDPNQSFLDWAHPLLTQVLEYGNFDALVDPRLRGAYNHNELISMVECASACVRRLARRRPRMSKVVKALEGEDVSLSNLNEETSPGHWRSPSHDTAQYNEDMKMFRKTILENKEYGSSDQYSISNKLE